jgi:primosomal protein N''
MSATTLLHTARTASINLAQYEELEARWNPSNLFAKHKQRVKGFVHDVGFTLLPAKFEPNSDLLLSYSSIASQYNEDDPLVHLVL